MRGLEAYDFRVSLFSVSTCIVNDCVAKQHVDTTVKSAYSHEEVYHCGQFMLASCAIQMTVCLLRQ
jgi:hypothetical protein